LAFLSACGFAACTLVYFESFFGATMDGSAVSVILLGIGVFVVEGPVLLREYPESRALSFYWTGFGRRMPEWVVAGGRLLLLSAIAHFIWFAVHSGRGVPTILDGQYVIDNRGHIVRLLTRGEYLKLQEAWLRGVVSIMLSCYFVPMMYWWFRRNELSVE
jgi:hypothetical protein